MLGHSLFVLDDDGVIRHTIPLVRSHDAVVPSVGLAAAMLARGIDWSTLRPEGAGLRIGNDLLPLTWRHIRDAAGESRYQWALIHYKGGTLGADMSTRTYTRYHASDVLEAENQLLREQRPELDPAVFKDKIVFVGATAEGLSDVFQTPFGRARMAGIQVHAAVTDDVLSSRFLKETSTPVRIATTLVMALAAGVLAVTIPAWWATLAVLVTIAVYATATTFALAAGHVLALFQPGLASALALFGGVGYQYFVEGRERRKMRRLFGQYVSKDVCAQLVANPELARLGGQRREMTVLFSDIRGFTTVTERGQPEEIVGMLNEYFTRMVDIVFKNNGTVDKFVGDMVMALFGAPLDDSAHPDHAVEAAIQMIEALGQLNRRWGAQGRFAQLDIGIGINTGPMIAGNIGSDQIMSYTVIGDAVNLGSRLESLNKQYGTRIIISEATRERLKNRYHVRPLGDVVVKGKTEPVAIFEVLGRGDGTMPSPTAMPTDTKAASEAHS
jgi:adenylate cyclase